MNQIDVDQYYDENITKLRSDFNNQETMSITSIENLSNEFFYEIFDYLDGYAIYQSFFNLNHRFQQLLNSSSLLFKIHVASSSEELLMNIYKQLILINKHQIISFHLGLPLEKTDESTISVSLPIATNEQLTTIKYLVINHSCTFNELCTIISYTPQLCHLNLMELDESYSNIELILPISLFNLTYISIQMCSIRFDELEMFITETECNLKVLRIITYSNDKDYLHGDRWEELILEYLPQLEEFYLEYYEQIDPESGYLTDFEPPNQFTSLFWIERQWVLEIEMDTSDIVYSIRSYKKRWYDINTSIELSKPTRLTLTNLPHDDYIMVLNLIFRDILIVAQIYHLEIFQKNIFSDTLLDIIHKLPALNSLKLSSLISPQSRWSSIDEKNLQFLSNKNTITKVYLEEMNRMEEIYFLIRLCPRMTYFNVHLINNINYELVLKNILIKINNNCNQYLRSLCLHVPTTDNKLTRNDQS